MEITEIRVFPKEGQDKKLKAYVTVTFDDVFVVRNIKVIQGSNALFIAMPSRKVKNTCPNCGFKNEAGSRFCNHCAGEIPPGVEQVKIPDAKVDHRDIAHPITQEFREYLQRKILEAYKKEGAAGGSSSQKSLHEIDE
jgi:stage V sporulation protein G